MSTRAGNSRKFAVVAAILAALAVGGRAQAVETGGIFGALEGLFGESSTSGIAELTTEEISGGLREALRIGTERVIEQIGRTDGFNADPAIHIPLPSALQKAQSVLQTIGMSGLADDLELKLNRAAEAAVPEAKKLFWDSITEMTLDDVHNIYEGPNDAATQYFKAKMSGSLAERMAPIVHDTISEVGAVHAYDAMIDRYRTVPFVPDVKTDLTGYVVEKALDGTFHYVALEEAKIRENPAARTTELLEKVFGSAN